MKEYRVYTKWDNGMEYNHVYADTITEAWKKAEEKYDDVVDVQYVDQN